MSEKKKRRLLEKFVHKSGKKGLFLFAVLSTKTGLLIKGWMQTRSEHVLNKKEQRKDGLFINKPTKTKEEEKKEI